jgi:hypothetical protein
LVLRSKGILVLFWQGKALGLVEGDDEDSGLGGLDNGGLGQRLGSGCENVSQLLYGAPVEGDAPMVFSVVGVVAPALGWPFSSLSVMVDVEGEREKALRGPRCVSLSFFVSFQDMMGRWIWSGQIRRREWLAARRGRMNEG